MRILYFLLVIGVLYVSCFAKNESWKFWNDNKNFYLIESWADAQCKIRHLKKEVFRGSLEINECTGNKCKATAKALYNLDVFGKCLSSPNHDIVGFYPDDRTLVTFCNIIQIEHESNSKQVSFLLKDEGLCLYKGISKTDLMLKHPVYEYGVMEVKKSAQGYFLRVIPKEPAENNEMGIIFHSCKGKRCGVTLSLNGEPQFSKGKVSIQSLCDFVHVEKENETDVLSWGRIEVDHQGTCDLRILSQFGKEKITITVPEKISDLSKQSKKWTIR